MKQLKNALACAALAGLVIAQPVAAATRSYESLPQTGIQQPVSLERADALAGDFEQLRGGGQANKALIILLVFGGLLALFAALGLFGDGEDFPGTPDSRG